MLTFTTPSGAHALSISKCVKWVSNIILITKFNEINGKTCAKTLG